MARKKATKKTEKNTRTAKSAATKNTKPAPKPAVKPRRPRNTEEPIEATQTHDIIDLVEDDTIVDDLEDTMRINFKDDHDEMDVEDLSEPDLDFFNEVYRIASSRGQSPKYYIKKDGQLIGSMNHPCSWEILQKTYGGGHYNIQARAMGTGQFIKSTSELVADIAAPETPHHEDVKPAQSGAYNLELLAMMNKFQEQSENKAAASAAAQSNSLAAMMQVLVSSQQQSSQQMQTMILEMNKQAQAQAQSQQTLLMTLITTMMNQKPVEAKSDFNALTVLKMIQDAEKSAETRTKSWFELVEKKAESLAEEKAAALSSKDEEEESLTKTVIKGFIPVISQLVQSGGINSSSPQTGPSHQEIQRAQMIDAARRHREEQARLNAPPEKTPGLAPRPGVPQSFDGTKPVQNAGPLNRNNVVNLKDANKNTNLTEDNKVSAESELKKKIIETIQGDIAQGFMLNRKAANVAEHCVKKLEKRGIMRQTLTQTFSLQELYDLAQHYGVLEKAKPWITEFYETLAQKPATVNGVTESATTAVPVV